MTIQAILSQIAQGKRINPQEALTLATEANVLELGRLANDMARKKNGDKAAYLIDRNINYTNVCTARCSFCAFYRPLGHKQSYLLNYNEIDEKICETLAVGGGRILMQGGFHPEHNIDTYVDLIKHIKKNHPIHIHAFSPPEIHHGATQSGISYEEAMDRLVNAGLGSIPGGGAEILVDRVRNEIAVGKCSAQQWLDVCEAAHLKGIKVTATMMMGHIETWAERIEHLDKLRSLQDKTQGFISFIPWSFQPEHTALHPKAKRNKHVKLAGAYEYLKLLSLSRIYLDNFDHIQVSLLTQGAKVAQMGLHFGADDLGSLLIEENVVRLAGKPQEKGLKVDWMREIIRDAGLIPYERDTFYNEIQSSENADQARVLSA